MHCRTCGRKAVKGASGGLRDPFYCTGCDRTPGRCRCASQAEHVRAEIERLERENASLAADLAVFTTEPGILARVGGEHTTYWYNQTARVASELDRVAGMLDRLRETGLAMFPEGAYFRVEGPTIVLNRAAVQAFSVALAATPAPKPAP